MTSTGSAARASTCDSVRHEERDVEITTAERYASGGPGRDLIAQNLVKSFETTVGRLGDDVAIRTADDSVTLSWNDVRDRSRAIAGGLASLGVSKGDTVALLMSNRVEFIPIDLGAVSLGAVPFSVYPTLTPDQIQYVLSDAGARVQRRGHDHAAGARRKGDLVAARGPHRRARRALLPAGQPRAVGDDLPRPAKDRRVPAPGAADVVLRRAADLGEAQGRARGDGRQHARGAGREGACRA